MTDLNLGRIISRYVNYQSSSLPKQNISQETASSFTQEVKNSVQSSTETTPAPKMAEMAGTDQATYLRDMMKLPKNMNEFLYMLQKNITLAQLNQQFAQAGRASLSQTQAQILAQLQGLSITDEILLNNNRTLATQMQNTLRNLTISSTGMINLSDIALLIQTNGKDAITKLITTMANSSKFGITDLSQLKETAKLINASIATAAKNDNAQTMKLLMLLYLPWLPLQEGVGFDLEIETGPSSDDKDSILVITITTINYGNVKAILVLCNANSVHVNIECSSEFPKDELLMRIENDEKYYSMESVISFETNSNINSQQKQEKPQAKINMSDTNQINSFLLLMAHTIIRHVIEIDKNTSNGIVSHTD